MALVATTRLETLSLIGTGRPSIQAADDSYSMPYAQPGGLKVAGVSLSNNSVYNTYTFPSTVNTQVIGPLDKD
jgi:hypothetical protein